MLLIAVFVALARSLDVVTDPSMSYWTDSTRSKWGRRRPFLVLGCVPYATSLIMLLTPPRILTVDEVSLWFGMTYIVFFRECATPTTHSRHAAHTKPNSVRY